MYCLLDAILHCSWMQELLSCISKHIAVLLRFGYEHLPSKRLHGEVQLSLNYWNNSEVHRIFSAKLLPSRFFNLLCNQFPLTSSSSVAFLAALSFLGRLELSLGSQCVYFSCLLSFSIGQAHLCIGATLSLRMKIKSDSMTSILFGTVPLITNITVHLISKTPNPTG